MKPKADMLDTLVAEVHRRRRWDVPVVVTATVVFIQRVLKDEIDERSLEAFALTGFRATRDGVTLRNGPEREEAGVSAWRVARDVVNRIGESPPERLTSLKPDEVVSLALVGFTTAVVGALQGADTRN